MGTRRFFSLLLRPRAWVILNFVVALSGCGGQGILGGLFGADEDPSKPCVSEAAQHVPFVLTGRVQYERAPAVKSGTSSGRINYSAEETKPARRVIVQAVDNCGNAVAESRTDDGGNYSLSVAGYDVKVRALAALKEDSYERQGSEACNGAAWNVSVLDNTQGQAQYAHDSVSSYVATASGVNLTASLTHVSGKYTSRAAAPFALIDTVLNGIEKVCQGSPAAQFPLLYVNWSANNVAISGERSLGEIITSHFTIEQGVRSIYILGKEGADTDELDDHVVAHEFGHYVEDSFYRADSIGGSHALGDELEPTVAFGEGFGNAFSAIASVASTDLVKATYVDTSGSSQASGFSFSVDTAPSGNDRGIYSEISAQHFLWRLYANGGQNFLKIHQALEDGQRLTPALTTLQSFASYYRNLNGSSSESLQTLWGTTLGGNIDSLCVGTCANGAGGTADPFDQDGDLGLAYEASRNYGVSPVSYLRDFWNPYRALNSGTNAATDHDMTSKGGYDYADNKFGMNRWYRYTHAGAPATVRITVQSLYEWSTESESIVALSCSARDSLDMYIYRVGDFVAVDDGSGGCPQKSFTAQQNQTYVIVIQGYEGEVSKYDIVIQ